MSLKRVLGASDAAWLVAGNMIGAGIFITPGLVAAELPGTLAPLVAWVLGGLLSLCGAAVYGELGARLPQAGGDYQYLNVAFGSRWGFLTGWAAFTLSFSGAAAVMAIVVVNNVAAAWPLLGQAAEVWRRGLAALLIMMLTLANVAGSRAAGRTTVWLTALPVAGLVLLFVLGLWRGDLNGATGAVEAKLPRGSWLALGAAMLPVYFTYSGWNAAAYVAGEIRSPGRDLCRGLVAGTLGVTLFYVAFNALLFFVLPRQLLAGSTTAAAVAARLLLGAHGEQLLSVVGALAVLGSATVTLMAGARIYYAMALDGLAPRTLGRVNAAGVPAAALWAGGIWTALLATTGRIGALVDWATLAILLLSALAVASLFVLRRGRTGVAASTPYRCPAYPLVPLVYLLASLAVAVASALRDWRQALYGVLLVAAGVPVHALWRRFQPRER